MGDVTDAARSPRSGARGRGAGSALSSRDRRLPGHVSCIPVFLLPPSKGRSEELDNFPQVTWPAGGQGGTCTPMCDSCHCWTFGWK